MTVRFSDFSIFMIGKWKFVQFFTKIRFTTSGFNAHTFCSVWSFRRCKVTAGIFPGSTASYLYDQYSFTSSLLASSGDGSSVLFHCCDRKFWRGRSRKNAFNHLLIIIRGVSTEIRVVVDLIFVENCTTYHFPIVNKVHPISRESSPDIPFSRKQSRFLVQSAFKWMLTNQSI
jgi:hypothetical protein